MLDINSTITFAETSSLIYGIVV